MKKIGVTVFISFFATVYSVNAASLSLGAGYLNFNSSAKKIYNNTNIYYLGELSFNLKKLEPFFNINLNNFKGELSYNKDETTLKLTQLETGIKLPFGKKTFPYIGAGVNFTLYNETNSIGTASGSGFGFFGIGGFKISFGKLFLDLRAKYTMLKIKGSDLSGISGIVMIGFIFK